MNSVALKIDRCSAAQELFFVLRKVHITSPSQPFSLLLSLHLSFSLFFRCYFFVSLSSFLSRFSLLNLSLSIQKQSTITPSFSYIPSFIVFVTVKRKDLFGWSRRTHHLHQPASIVCKMALLGNALSHPVQPRPIWRLNGRVINAHANTHLLGSSDPSWRLSGRKELKPTKQGYRVWAYKLSTSDLTENDLGKLECLARGPLEKGKMAEAAKMDSIQISVAGKMQRSSASMLFLLFQIKCFARLCSTSLMRACPLSLTSLTSLTSR